MTVSNLGGRRCGKSLVPLAAFARVHGWDMTWTRGGHLRFSKPGRQTVYASGTPGDWRSSRNAMAMLSRADRHFAEECVAAEEVPVG